MARADDALRAVRTRDAAVPVAAAPVAAGDQPRAAPRRPSLATLTLVSAVAAVVLVATSWQIAAVPTGWHRAGPLPYVACYLALATMIGSWLELGRRVLAADAAISPAALRRYVLASAVPLLAAAPFGRDLWAYAAQGNLVAHGIDPYTHGPSALSGTFTDQVSHRWLHSPSPYGPLWLQLCHGVDSVVGQHVVVAALLLRLPAFAGLLLWLWALPRLASRFDGRLGAALWLGAASPLTLVLGIGGGHNDVAMIGLLLAGLAIACGRSLAALVLGTAVITCAVLVKSPAAIAVAFAVPSWLHAGRHRPTVRHVISACLIVAATAVAVGSAVTAVCGLGTGWTHQVSTDAPWVSWLSLPSGVAMLGKVVTGHVQHLKAVGDALRVARAIGEALTVAVTAALWFLALRRGPITCLAVALGAAAVLAPSVQPWYYCWALALAGLVARQRRLIITLAAVSIAFPVMITPSGVGLESSPAAVIILAGAATLAWLALRGRPSAADDNRPDHPGAEVGTDHRTQFSDVQLPGPG